MKKRLLFALFTLFLASCQTKSPRIISEDIVPVTISNITDSSMFHLIEPYKAQLDSDIHVVIGRSAIELTRGLPEASLNTFVADAMLDYGRKIKPTDIAITNLGGLRTDLQEGPITVGDVMQVMPFDNAMVFVELSGKEVNNLCDAIAAKGGEVVAGISMKIVGDKAEDVLIQGKPIDENRTYLIITTDYLSYGNDHLEPLANFKTIESLDILVRDLLIGHIMNETKAGRAIQPTLKNNIYVEK